LPDKKLGYTSVKQEHPDIEKAVRFGAGFERDARKQEMLSSFPQVCTIFRIADAGGVSKIKLLPACWKFFTNQTNFLCALHHALFCIAASQQARLLL
jgi:hypothetical protein